MFEVLALKFSYAIEQLLDSIWLFSTSYTSYIVPKLTKLDACDWRVFINHIGAVVWTWTLEL